MSNATNRSMIPMAAAVAGGVVVTAAVGYMAYQYASTTDSSTESSPDIVTSTNQATNDTPSTPTPSTPTPSTPTPSTPTSSTPTSAQESGDGSGEDKDMDMDKLDNTRRTMAFAETTLPGHSSSTKVYKDQCLYCFRTPVTSQEEADSLSSTEGLYLSLSCFHSACRAHLATLAAVTSSTVFLHIKSVKDEGEASVEADKYKLSATTYAYTYSLCDANGENEVGVVLEGDGSTKEPVRENMSESVGDAVRYAIQTSSATFQEEVSTWEGEEVIPLPGADEFEQVANPPKIKPSGWKCALCDLTENLWLNLSDGTILCGRRNWDGSGGNGHALAYYEEKGLPLVVKLGTITAEGGDCYHYGLDAPVHDPELGRHMAHFGINVAVLDKTEKTVAELEAETNLSYQFSKIVENGEDLVALFGPGNTGMANIGNSCYMNSTLQVLFSLPEFVSAFADPEAATTLMNSTQPSEFVSSAQAQLTKLGMGLMSGDFSPPPPEGVDVEGYENPGIEPRSVKAALAGSNPEFSGKGQQDVEEYIRHVFGTILEGGSAGPAARDATGLFGFTVEDRYACSVSGAVEYKTRPELVLSLNLPLAEGDADKDPEELAKTSIPFTACVEHTFQPNNVPGYLSHAAGDERVTAVVTSGLKTFPKYLWVQVRRFAITSDWRAVKIGIDIQAPDVLDLESLIGRASGPAEGEVLQPEDQASGPAPVDEESVSMVMAMGFDRKLAEDGLRAMSGNVEAAIAWIFENPGGAPEEAAAAAPTGPALDENSVAMVMAMGFDRKLAEDGLRATSGNVEAAIAWIFENPGGAPEEAAGSSEPAGEIPTSDGAGVYGLRAIISHIGNSTKGGHYVCHVNRGGEGEDAQWVFCNDEKIAESQAPPKGLGYMYLYERAN